MPNKRGGSISSKSLENLKLGRRKGHGRTQDYEQPKKQHGITVTDLGWEGLESLAEKAGVSISELLERIGRGLLSVSDTKELVAVEAQSDQAESK